MVRSRPPSGCVATRLVICILMGLRVVSASLSGSPSEVQLSTHQLSKSNEPLCPQSTSKKDLGQAATKHADEAQTGRLRNKRYISFTRESEASTTELLQQQGVGQSHEVNRTPRDSVDGPNVSTTSNNLPLSPAGPSSSSTDDHPLNVSSSSELGSEAEAESNEPSTIPSENGDKPGYTTVASASSLDPDTASISSTLSSIDYDGQKSISSSTNQSANASLPNTNDGTTDSNRSFSPTIGSPSMPQGQSPSNKRNTTAIAVGVTVPVAVILLGLITLVVLRKQRHRRSASHTQILSTNADEETVKASERTSHTGSTIAPKNESGPVRSPDRQMSAATAEASQDEPATLRSEAVSESPTVAIHLVAPRVSDTASNSSPSIGNDGAATRTVGLKRSLTGKSLKRKPVPPLFDGEQHLQPLS